MNTGKRIFHLIIILSTLLLFTYCDDNHFYDNTPPSPPTNVITYVGDNQVEITWNDSRENDVAGYNVYYSYSYNGEYQLIGNTTTNYYIDVDAINGELYYYAVTAYDYDGNESELSYDEVYGVARPEGRNVAISDYLTTPELSGYDFSEYTIGPYNEVTDDYSADFFFENFEGEFYLNVWDDTDIQDMGFTESFYDITYAPIDGYVELIDGENVKYVPAQIGHTYIIWTWDNHFAKVRVKSITGNRLVFDWAYQLLEGEQMLKSKKETNKRKSIPKLVIKNK